MRHFNSAVIGVAILMCCCVAVHAGCKDDIGYTMLQGELGGSTPDGSGVIVTQAEALFHGGLGLYKIMGLPDVEP
jgi:hypothetical protein